MKKQILTFTMYCVSNEQREQAEVWLVEMFAKDDMILVKKTLSIGGIIYSAVSK
jgi:hypothetical protein